MKKTLATLLAFMLVMPMVICVPFTASAFNPDNYKAQIKSISVGAPITGLDGNKYLPVDVHFTANEDLGDSNAVFFLEGYLKGALAQGGDFEGISGLGMTLMGPLKPDALEGMGSNAYSWQWSEGYGEGVLKYNIPLKGENDTQTIEQSGATGLQEVNCLNEGDTVSFSIETVMNTDNFPPEALPEGGSLFSDERTITIEDISKYPKTVEFGNTCTITVHYVYEDGSQAAPDVVKTYEIGFINYIIESPTIEGYTPDRIGVTGLPSGDKEETVTYSKNLPDLSTAQITGLSEDENKKYTEEEAKNIGLEGLVKDVDYTSSVTTDKNNEKWIVTLEPVEGKSTGEKVIELKKAEDTCTITVHYVYEDGSQAAPDVVKTYEIGFINYIIESPTIEGYTPDRIGVTGLPSGDKEETVTYTKNVEPAQFTVKAEKTNIKVGETTTIKVDGASGTVSFTSDNNKIAKVDKNGNVKGVAKGKTAIVVENNGVKKTVEFSVTKKANSFTVKNKTFTIKSNKKKVINLNKKLKFKNKKGNLTYKKKSGNKKITVSKKGKLTVKKGLKKGKTYTVKVRVTDNGNNTFNKKSKTVRIRIKIK